MDLKGISSRVSPRAFVLPEFQREPPGLLRGLSTQNFPAPQYNFGPFCFCVCPEGFSQCEDLLSESEAALVLEALGEPLKGQ
jgi:hypothetical protein